MSYNSHPSNSGINALQRRLGYKRTKITVSARNVPYIKGQFYSMCYFKSTKCYIIWSLDNRNTRLATFHSLDDLMAYLHNNATKNLKKMKDVYDKMYARSKNKKSK